MIFFKRKDPILIDGYQSYGSDNHLYVLGRALEHEGVNLKKKGIFSTIKNSYRQFATDELRHTRIRVTLPDDRIFYTTTDAEGYFKLDQKVEGLSVLANDEGWLQLKVSFDEIPKDVSIINDNEFLCEMLIPSNTTEYGVISDIDDTILHTGVASMLKWRLILNTLFKNVRKRVSIEGTPELYQKLQSGVSGKASNPIFYVSNSPWNLYNYLETFVRNHLFPRGPVLLRDFRTPFEKTPKPEIPHKQHEIRNILTMYPDLKFVLIGDSGEHDVDIYLEVAKEYPDQILAVYLRSVDDKKRVARVKKVLKQFGEIPAVLVEKSAFAEKHARENALIV